MKEHQTQIRILLVLVLVTGVLFFLSRRTVVAPEQPIEEPKQVVDFSSLDGKTIETKTITDTTSPYLEITASYPVGVVGADAVEKEVRGSIAEFKSGNDFSKMDKEELALLGFFEGRQYALIITYQGYHTKKFLTHRLDIYTDTGGAHGGTEVRTFTYDAKGSLVTFMQLLQEGKLAPFASFIQQKLKNDATMIDRIMVDWLSEGAGPHPPNFASFAFDQDVLRIIFQQYQIGPYVSGIIELQIPFTELGSFLKSEYLE